MVASISLLACLRQTVGRKDIVTDSIPSVPCVCYTICFQIIFESNELLQLLATRLGPTHGTIEQNHCSSRDLDRFLRPEFREVKKENVKAKDDLPFPGRTGAGGRGDGT